MRNRVTGAFLLLAWLLAPTAARAGDPYAGITIHTLANGMTIVLAPSPNARNIEVEFRLNTGWNGEDSSNLGVAHLVEHALFRDDRLGSDQSYIQLVKERANGSANGVTSWKATSFQASVPSLKGVWVLNEFARMLFNRKLTQPIVEKSASEVLLELGEPGNLLQSVFQHLNPLNWEQPDFFESEFDVPANTQPEEAIRRRARKLTAEQAQAFYDKFYAPGNFVLFYAGPFKTKETLDFMKETFDVFPERPFTEIEDPSPHPRMKPYLRSRFATRDSWISVGTKFWDITAEDELILQLYFDNLAHRLMKKLRNEAGETYSTDGKVWVDDARYGYAVVSFETPRNQFAKNLTYLDNLILDEAERGRFSDDDIRAARSLLAGESQLIDSGADTAMKLADRLYTFRHTYQTIATPYEVFERISNDTIRERLKALFVPEHRYRSLVEPPLAFRGEIAALGVLVALLSVLLCRLWLLRPFDHTSVRYVRKVKYRPVFLFALGVLYFNLVWILCQVAALADRLLLHWNFFQSTYVLSQYFEGAVFVLCLITMTMGLLSLIPRKLIVVDNHLVLKSLTYYSRRFPRTSVRQISSCRPYHLVSHKLIRPRLRFLHWALWKKGILLELKKGDAYYLGFRDADKVIDELEEILGERTVTGHAIQTDRVASAGR